MKKRGLLLAIGLNVVVSAVVTWAVLAWWQDTHPCPPLPAATLGTEATQPANVPTDAGPWFAYVVQPDDTWPSLNRRFGLSPGTLQRFNGLPADAPLMSGQMLRVPGTPPPTPTGDPRGLEIVAVPGAGSLPDEHVRLRYRGAQPLNLAGWTLEDADGHRFHFPDLVLYPEGELQIWTKAGTATLEALYWGLSEPVWSSGETVTLRAPDGSVVATYRVP